MKKKEMISRFFLIPHYEIGAIEEYLEKMALEGLFFCERRGYRWYFKKGEPKKLRYYVDIFDKASWFDTRPESETLDYLEYCRAGGWEHICTDGKYQFFYSENEDAVAIETDQKKKLRMLHNASVVNCLVIPAIWVAYAFFLLKSFLEELTYAPNAWIEMSIAMTVLYLIILVFGLMEVITLLRYVSFYFKNRIRIKRGAEIEMSSLPKVQRYQNTYFLVLLLEMCFCIGILFLQNKQMGIFVLIMTVCMFGAAWLASFLKQRNSVNHSRIYNIGQTIMFTIMTCVVVSVCISVIGYTVVRGILYDDDSMVITYTDEEGEEIHWYISQDEIPYSMEDAGIEIPKDGYRDTSVYIDKMLFCSLEAYYDSYYEDVYSEAVYSMDYEKYEFLNSEICKIWIDNYLSNSNWTVTSSEELAKLWNAEAVYLRESKEDDDYKKYVIVYDGKCYLLSENLIDKTELMDILN